MLRDTRAIESCTDLVGYMQHVSVEVQNGHAPLTLAQRRTKLQSALLAIKSYFGDNGTQRPGEIDMEIAWALNRVGASPSEQGGAGGSILARVTSGAENLKAAILRIHVACIAYRVYADSTPPRRDIDGAPVASVGIAAQHYGATADERSDGPAERRTERRARDIDRRATRIVQDNSSSEGEDDAGSHLVRRRNRSPVRSSRASISTVRRRSRVVSEDLDGDEDTAGDGDNDGDSDHAQARARGNSDPEIEETSSSRRRLDVTYDRVIEPDISPESVLVHVVPYAMQLIVHMVLFLTSACAVHQIKHGGQHDRDRRVEVAGGPDSLVLSAAHEKDKDIHVLLNTLYERASYIGLRRFRGALYREIIYEGKPTHAWEEAYSFDKFVDSVCSATDNYVLWQMLMSCMAMRPFITRVLAEAHDVRMPDLLPNRYVRSFTNGVLFLDEEQFYLYGSVELDRPFVSCKFFPVEFDTSMCDIQSPRDILTPALDSIYDAQQIPNNAVRDWITLMFFGRPLYLVGELDKKEFTPFIKGLAGTGKSTMGKILAMFFPANGVGVLSSNIERQFGLGAIADKDVWICYEVRSSFQLDQGDLQSMITGEQMNIARKHLPSLSQEWRVPGVMMGNQSGSWIDAAGSMSRRLVFIPFDHKVFDMDPTLMDRLFAELPNIMFKANSLYRAMCSACPTQDIWSLLPRWFHNARVRLQADINPLLSFLMSKEKVVLSPGSWIPLSVFRELYVDGFCKGRKINFNPDHYTTTFQEHGMRVSEEELPWGMGGMLEKQIYVIGACRKEDAAGQAEWRVQQQILNPEARVDGAIALATEELLEEEEEEEP